MLSSTNIRARASLSPSRARLRGSAFVHAVRRRCSPRPPRASTSPHDRNRLAGLLLRTSSSWFRRSFPSPSSPFGPSFLSSSTSDSFGQVLSLGRQSYAKMSQDLFQVTDLKNVSGPGKKELRQATKKALALLQDNYPEFVAKQTMLERVIWHMQHARIGLGESVVFVARNRFVVFDKSCNHAVVKNLNNDVVKRTSLPLTTDAIFYAKTNNLLCSTEDRVMIFDLQQCLILGELQVHVVKYVVWSIMNKIIGFMQEETKEAEEKTRYLLFLNFDFHIKYNSQEDIWYSS